MRLHANVEAVERYGASVDLIEKIPLFLEKKLDEEKIAAYEV